MKAKYSLPIAPLFVVAALNGCSSSENQKASEQPTTYEITLAATEGGVLSLTSTQIVEEGTGFSVTVTPDTGYRIESANGCGGTLTDNTFTADTVTADCTINIAFSRKGELNDTGITLCGNYDAENENQWSSTINCADAGATQTADGIDADGNLVPAGQDAHYGRDALAANGQLAKTGAGAAGFDFIKLDSNGNDLPETATEWSCVRDNVTGLIWEVKAPSDGNVGNSLHDADDLFSWYSSDSADNGGVAGYSGPDDRECYGHDSEDRRTYCNTEAFVERVNAKGLCGADDWRMPTREELRSIVHYGQEDPSIDTNYFPNTMGSLYLSGSTVADYSDYMWVVGFDNGLVYSLGNKDDHDFGLRHNFFVRLVRGTR